MKLSSAAFLLGLMASASADFNGLRRLSRSRDLQTDCSTVTWSKDCKQTTGCTWAQGECKSTAPSGPTPATPSPTRTPTRSPVPEGVGFCSDDPGRQCEAASDCVCSGAPASSLDPEATNLFKRRRVHNEEMVFGRDRALLVCPPDAKRNQCPSDCVWNGGCSPPVSSEPLVCPPEAKRKECPSGCIWNGGCFQPVAIEPTKQPTRSPTHCSCLGLPTQAPTTGPTSSAAPSGATYIPGDLSVPCDGKLMLSTGLDCKLLTRSGQRVTLANGSQSSDLMHSKADGAGVVPSPDGGWYYVSNSEDSRGGVGTLRFDSSGDLIGYDRTMDTTQWNCGGGRTPWHTWVSCEENGSQGRCHEVDPHTKFFQEVDVVARGGNYESFAYDDQDPSGTRFFTTEDASDGALTRYTPNPDAYKTGNKYNILNYSAKAGIHEYLVLNEGDKTFSWTTDISAGRASAGLFPRSEGIDVHNRILSFVSKSNKRLFTLDLENGTWSSTTTLSGAFNLQPDQLGRIIGDGDLLYFCEDGGSDCDVHGRDSTGKYFTIVRGDGYSTETTGLAFSPNGMFMYVAFQSASNIYSFWRTDGMPFNGTVADTKYHP